MHWKKQVARGIIFAYLLLAGVWLLGVLGVL